MRIKVNKFGSLGYSSLLILVLFGFITIFASCGGDDDGGNNIVNNTTQEQETGVSLADLAGTWYGVQEDDTGALSKLQVTIDGSGNITQVLEDGADIGVTATVTKEDDQIFSFVDSEGTEGGFFVDAAAQHAAFLSEDFYFVVLQKGASSLPTYGEDLVGSWSGYGLALDSDFEIVESWNSNATVASDGSFTGSNTLGTNFNGSFSSYSSVYGMYYGDYSGDDGSYGEIRALLSVDKTFVGTWAVDDSGDGYFPDDYSFEFWSKQ